MEGINIAIIIDIVILIALVATSVFAIRLSRQFSILHTDRESLENLVTNLSNAVDRAESAIQSMKKTAMTEGEGLQASINKSRQISQELEIMIEAGDNLAERLQNIAQSSRKAVKPAAQTKITEFSEDKKKNTEKPESPTKKTKYRSRAEQELFEALQAKQSKG